MHTTFLAALSARLLMNEEWNRKRICGSFIKGRLNAQQITSKDTYQWIISIRMWIKGPPAGRLGVSKQMSCNEAVAKYRYFKTLSSCEFILDLFDVQLSDMERLVQTQNIGPILLETCWRRLESCGELREIWMLHVSRNLLRKGAFEGLEKHRKRIHWL